MLKAVCDAARARAMPVSMCGEMAGEPVNALVLLGLGVTELSMNGPSIPVVKRVLRAAKASDGRVLLERILAMTFADDIEREVREEMGRRFPGLLEQETATVGAGVRMTRPGSRHPLARDAPARAAGERAGGDAEVAPWSNPTDELTACPRY